jgi:hypothetical protein
MDAAAHLVDQALRDGKPEARAAVASRRTGIRLLELGEDALNGVGRHSRPRVAHGEAEHRFVLARITGAPGA